MNNILMSCFKVIITNYWSKMCGNFQKNHCTTKMQDKIFRTEEEMDIKSKLVSCPWIKLTFTRIDYEMCLCTLKQNPSFVNANKPKKVSWIECTAYQPNICTLSSKLHVVATVGLTSTRSWVEVLPKLMQNILWNGYLWSDHNYSSNYR